MDEFELLYIGPDVAYIETYASGCANNPVALYGGRKVILIGVRRDRFDYIDAQPGKIGHTHSTQGTESQAPQQCED